MITTPHRPRPNLGLAVASVIGVVLSPFSPSNVWAGEPTEMHLQEVLSNPDPSRVVLRESPEEAPSEQSESAGNIPTGSISKSATGTAEKPATASFRVHAPARVGNQPASFPKTALAGFRVHTTSRAGLDDEESGGNQPVSSFRLHAVSRDDAEFLVRRRSDLSSLTPSANSVNPIGSGPTDPSNSSPNPGYYPTRKEWDTIGGYYPRTQMDNAGGAESARDTTAPAGLWPYPSAQDPLFGAHPAFFDAVDRYLGLFAPTGGLTSQGKNPSTGALYSLNTAFPLLTRSFNPNRATFKLGLAYIDLLDINSGLIWSQYRGPEVFPPGKGPGWLPFESLDFRVVVPLAQNLFLAASGEVYYLPRSGQVGFFFGDGYGPSLGLNAFAAYETNIHGWWLTVTDRLGTEDQFINLYTAASSAAFDQAGRYSFGNNAVANQSYISPFSSDAFFLVNTANASVIGLLNPTWRLQSDLTRTDAWNLDNFTLGNDYHGTTTASIKIDYAGQDWRFAPYAQYTTITPDDFRTFLNSAEIGIRGPITDQLRLFARVGYYWTTGLDPSTQGLLYEVGLTHEFGPYTKESLYGGSVVSTTDFGQRQEARYIRYEIDQVLSRRLTASLFAQWSDARDIDTLDTTDGYEFGAILNYQIGDFTELLAGVYYEKFDAKFEPDYGHLLYMVSLNHRIRAGLTARLIYQKERYQEVGGINNFNENLVELQLTQTF